MSSAWQGLVSSSQGGGAGASQGFPGAGSVVQSSWLQEQGEAAAKGCWRGGFVFGACRGRCVAPGRASRWGDPRNWIQGLFWESTGCRLCQEGRGDSPELWEHLNNPLSPLLLSSRPATTCQ